MTLSGQVLGEQLCGVEGMMHSEWQKLRLLCKSSSCRQEDVGEEAAEGGGGGISC